MSEIMDVERLRQRCAAGESFKYLYFWGHRPATDDKVGKSCFSQWYEASFKLDGVRYASAEHYMMAEKAQLFGDSAMRVSLSSPSLRVIGSNLDSSL